MMNASVLLQQLPSAAAAELPQYDSAAADALIRSADAFHVILPDTQALLRALRETPQKAQKETEIDRNRAILRLFILPEEKAADPPIDLPEGAEEFLQHVLDSALFRAVKTLAEENAALPAFRSYASNLSLFERDIRHTIEVKGIPEEDPSRSITRMVFDSLQTRIIGNILAGSLYRRIAEEAAPAYHELLSRLNSYLSSIGVYTYNALLPGMPMPEESFDHFAPRGIVTAEASMIGVVKEITRLRYFMRYSDFGTPAVHAGTPGTGYIYTSAQDE